jgi:hypothetical protein
MSLDNGGGGGSSRPPSGSPPPADNPEGPGGGGDLGPGAGAPPPETRACAWTWVWYEWRTAGGNACPKCAPYVGEWFREDQGPRPPLHPNCDCYLVAVYWECYSTTGERLEYGYY